MSTKKKEKKASSAAATARLGGTGFISFSDVVSTPPSPSSSSPSRYSQDSNKITPVYTGDNSDLSVACKKLLKKDATTKLRALAETTAVVRNIHGDAEQADPKVLSDFLPFFAFAFSKLVFDDSWQVREKLGLLLQAIIERDKQSLGPFMKDSIGPWWQLSADPVEEVATIFCNAFMNAIPPKRRPVVLLHLSSSIIKYITKCLKLDPTELKELTQCLDEELDEKYERMVRSNIDSLGQLLRSLSSEQNQQVMHGVSTSNDMLAGEEPVSYLSFFVQDSLLKHCKSKYSSVRGSIYKVFTDFAECIPSIWMSSGKHMELIVTVLLGSLDEKFDSNLAEGLHAMITVAKVFPEFWNKNAHVNILMQKLRSLLKSKAETLYQFFLPILSCIPVSKLGIYCEDNVEDPTQQAIGKGNKIVESLMQLLMDLETAALSPSVQIDVASCFMESVTFLILRKVSPTAKNMVIREERLKMYLERLISVASSCMSDMLQAQRSDYRESDRVILNSLLAFHKNSIAGNHISVSQWHKLLWLPLSNQIADLFRNEFMAACRDRTVPHQSNVLIRLFFKDVSFQVIENSSWNILDKSDTVGKGAISIVVSAVITCLDLLEVNAGSSLEDLHGVVFSLYQLLSFIDCTPNKLGSHIVTQMFNRSLSWLNLLMLGISEKNEKYFTLSSASAEVFKSLVTIISQRDFESPQEKWRIFQMLKDSSFRCSSFEGLYLLLGDKNFCSGCKFSVDDVQLLDMLVMIMTESHVHDTPMQLKMEFSRYKSIVTKMSLQFKLAFIFRVGASACLESSASRLIDFALNAWKSTETQEIMIWALLYISVYLKDNPSIYSQYFVDSNLLIWESDALYAIEKHCATLFLIQLDRKARPSGYPFSNPKDFFNQDVACWKSFVEDIFPHMHPSVRFRMLSNLSNEMSRLLHDEMMTPSTWSEYLTSFLLLKEKERDGESSGNLSLDIWSGTTWKFKQTQWIENNIQNTDALLLKSLAYIFNQRDHASGSMRCIIEPFFQDIKLYSSIHIALYYLLKSSTADINLKAAAKTIIFELIHIFMKFEAVQADDFVTKFLCFLGSDQDNHGYTSNDRKVLFELAEKLIAVCCQCENLTNTIIKPIEIYQPFPAQSLALKDRECYYLSIGFEEETESKLRRISCLSGKFIACHVENGPFHPYYSVVLGKSDGNAECRELQTEWNKLLFNFIPGCDLFENYAATDSAHQKLKQRSFNNKLKYPKIFNWLQNHITVLHQSIAPYVDASAVDLDRRLNWNDITTRLYLISRVFKFVDSRSEAEDQPFEEFFCAPLRGLVLFLSSEKLSYNINALRAVALLLKILTSSSAGIGKGLWLCLLLKNIYSSPLLQLPMEQLLKKAIDIRSLLVQLVHVCGFLHSGILDSNFLNWLIEHKIMVVLSTYISSGPTKLDDNDNGFSHVFQTMEERAYFNSLLRNHWAGMSTIRSTTENLEANVVVRSWETSAFDFLLREFLNLKNVEAKNRNNCLPFILRQQETKDMWIAMEGLHFSMLGRSREGCAQLIRSLSFSMYADKLLQDASPSYDRYLEGIQNATENYLDDFTNSQRLIIGKLLDIWIASGVLWENAIWPDSTSTATAASSESRHPVQEIDEDESSNDLAIIQYSLGGSLLDALQTRFDLDQVTQRSKQSLSHNLLQMLDVTGVDEENDELESLPDHIVDQMNDLVTLQEAGKNGSGTFLSHKQNVMGKKALFRSLESFDGFGTILVWLLTLQSIDSVCVKHWEARARCGSYLKSSGIFRRAVDFLVHLAGDLLKYKEISACFQRMSAIHTGKTKDDNSCWSILSRFADEDKSECVEGTIQQLACYALFRTISTLPAMFRNYWNDDCRRVDKTKLSRFVEERVRQSLIKREMALIRIARASKRWDDNDFEMKGNLTTGEIVASFLHDETKIEITIKIPTAYPLKNVHVDCTSRIGVSDGRWRRWLLQMIQLLSLQDGSVVDAALLWKRNIEKEMEGVEPCPICYCTIHTKTLKLPTLACPTCKNKFHPVCLHTWFKTSGKSKCVLCQQPMYF